MRQQVRAEVFHTLEGPQEGLLPPPLSNENLLINELVRDYLSFNGYANALGVFMVESGQPSDRSLDRAFLRDEVSIGIGWEKPMGGAIVYLLSDVPLVLFVRPHQASPYLHRQLIFSSLL